MSMTKTYMKEEEEEKHHERHEKKKNYIEEAKVNNQTDIERKQTISS